MGRNILKLDTRGIEELITRLDQLNGNVKAAVTDALTQAGETITDDTRAAIQPQHLPAKGKYSNGDTSRSIIDHPQVEWSGTIAEIGVGFDFGKPGAGGYLITGSPKMTPDFELQRIYKQKKYMSEIQKDMGELISDYIEEALEG